MQCTICPVCPVYYPHVPDSVDLAILLSLLGRDVTLASDELIDRDDNNKVMSFRSAGRHAIAAVLIRTPQQLFEEIMLSEVSACEANWVAFFVFTKF